MRPAAYARRVAAGEFSFSFRKQVPKLAIKPDTAAIDKSLPVLVLGDIPADVYAYVSLTIWNRGNLDRARVKRAA